MIQRYTLFLFILLASSCFKDENTTTVTIIKDDPRYIIEESEIVIEVADENEKPLIGLSAYYNDEIKVIDKSSFFHFKGNKINKFEELLKITDQSGYEYFYQMHSQENETNYKKINIFTNKQKGSFQSNEDYIIPISSNVKVNLVKDNYMVNINQNYTGKLEVRYNHYDLKNESHVRTLPGGKFGIKDNKKWLLQIEDAFEFNIFSSDNQKIAINKPVAMQVSTNNINSGLFYYDINSHDWTFIQDVASDLNMQILRTGTYCIAQVKEYTILKGQWKINQVPAQHSRIRLGANKFSDQVLTSNNGKWEAIVPQGEDVNISFESTCGVTGSKIVKASGATFDTGIFDTDSPELVTFKIKGQLVDCKDEPISEGFLKIQSTNISKTIYLDSSHFDLSVPLCTDDKISIFFTSTSSDYQTTLLKDINSESDLGTIYLCKDIVDNYLILKVDNNIRLYSAFSKTLDTEKLQIWLPTTNFKDEFSLKFIHNNTTGLLENSKSNIVWYDDQIGGFGIELNCGSSNNCGFEKIELTYFNQNDKLVKGNFKGRFWLKKLNPLGAEYKNITGEFQVKL